MVRPSFGTVSPRKGDLWPYAFPPGCADPQGMCAFCPRCFGSQPDEAERCPHDDEMLVHFWEHDADIGETGTRPAYDGVTSIKS